VWNREGRSRRRKRK